MRRSALIWIRFRLRTRTEPGPGVDQLRCDAHAIARFPHAAFEDVARAQFLAGTLRRDRLAVFRRGITF